MRKILVVDDQPGICLLLEDVLTSIGYAVTTANTGKEALDIIRNEPFELIIIDYQLPLLNGYEVIKQAAEEHITCPIIIMTGLIENVKEEYKNSNLVVEIVAKPFDIPYICELVNTILLENKKQDYSEHQSLQVEEKF